ncbi:ABC transporter ATP-binding protein [Hyphomonas sp. NPDC076900]|uniref:ABC transporter ATP-binding protein n=1 Tax=unclassified Hyphomonas TaxID=2630699 RepID=UPI003D04C8AD
MSSEPLIRLDNVSKHYLVYSRPEDRLKQMLLPRLSRVIGAPSKSYHRIFPAVSNVSLEVGRGETIGIVGRNGSGKSTLLQMICGTLQPTGGTIEVNGRIAALLELGSGFNPEFTGRENVFLNAAILGLSAAETEARFDKIAAFADIGPFLDQPVKTYSSGMYVRLAFAVATSIDPDILIVDEALSVGDEAFQRKCFNRIETIKENGGTILFVSHGAQTIVQLCDRAVLIDRGEKLLEGHPKVVVNHYQRMMNLSGAEADEARAALKSVDGWAVQTAETEAPEAAAARPSATDGMLAEAWYDPKLVSMSQVEYTQKGARILDVHITNAAGERVNNLVLNEKYFYRYDVEFDAPMANVNFAMFVKTISGIEIAGQHAFAYDQHISVEAGDRFSIAFPFDCPFLPGTYSCNCGVFTRSGNDLDIRHRILDAILFRVMPTDARYSRQGMVDLCPNNEPVSVEVKALRKTA